MTDNKSKQRRGALPVPPPSYVKAGEVSGEKRAMRAAIRRNFVLAAFETLPKANRDTPYSDDTLDKLMEAYDSLILQSLREAASRPPGESERHLREAAGLPPRVTPEGDNPPPDDPRADARLLKRSQPFKMGRETLKKDLKALGLRSRRRNSKPLDE
jgi:hypothetical protein